MSGEQLSRNGKFIKNSNKDHIKKNKVDINILLNRIRVDQKKEKLENVIFIGLISFLVIVTGVLVSL